MPFKRSRRSSSVSEDSVSITDINEDSLQSGSSSISTRKRRREMTSKLELSHCSEILDKLKNVKAEDGHYVMDCFLRLPSKRSAADYYDVITTPIDILKIQSYIKNDKYDNFLDFESDMEQLVENAKTYHTSSAQEYQDAVVLWNAYEHEKQNIITKVDVKGESHSGNESRSRRGRKRIAISVDDGLSDQISLATSDDSRNTSEISSEVVVNPLEAFFAAVVTQKTESGKDLAPTFTYLPSKAVYPQYYEVIKEPIDLRKIARRIKSSVYLSIDDVERDFILMVKNAKVFNEPKSDVYSDAVELQKIVKMKRTELDTGVKMAVKRKRGRKRKIPLDLTEKYASLESSKETDDESEETDFSLENVVDIETDLNIPETDNRYQLWQLYKAVTGITWSNGANPADPFMKLPSKKHYPDYFLEILEPMSLLMIKAKIHKSMYKNIDEMLRDLDLVFNNAQQFNVEDSAIYKEAVALQNLAHMKKQEIVNSTQYSNDLPSKKMMKSELTTSTPRRTRPPMTPEELKNKRIHNLFQSIYNAQENNRYLRDIFMSLPSKEEYPEYYKVILEPIDLTTIRKKIEEHKYPTHMDLINDLKLMLSNAKHFNEPSSQVHQDAITLEKLIKKKMKNMGANSPGSQRPRKKPDSSVTTTSSSLSPLFSTPINYTMPCNRIREIFQTVKEYRDISGRLLSEPFIKLPSKQDLPEYYEYIKKPIELQTIQYRINNERYTNVDELMSDLVLMFDNACRFNEPDSQIYRDSLILMRVALEKKAFLVKDDNLSDPPSIQDIIEHFIENLFNQFYEYVDEDGRFLKDSLNQIEGIITTRRACAETPTANLIQATETCRLNLTKIKTDIRKRRYRRLDRLQEDVFAYLKHVRLISSINSQAYEDSYELQRIFVKLMDVHCKHGELILSPALNYNERCLHQDIEIENKEKKDVSQFEPGPHEDDENIIRQMTSNGNYRLLDTVNRLDSKFEIGDFVRIHTSDVSMQGIAEITGILVPNSDSIETDETSDGCLIRVKIYYHPHQTASKGGKRYFDREVFQTSVYETIPMKNVIGKCLVMYVKDYLRLLPKGFIDTDIYICESYYAVQSGTFTKIKNWTYRNSDIAETFIEREDRITVTRSYYSFDPEPTEDFVEYSFVVENVKESVLQEDRTRAECCIYYDQFVCDNGFSVKVGDYVYVKSDNSKNHIVRIDQLWKNVMQGVVYFSGPWFINAMDVEHLPSKVFYKKEVFLSSVDGATHLLTSIVGKCLILSYFDYCKYRPTEYKESDVYVCEFKYFTDDKVARKLKKGLKKAQLSTKALDDEIYFFKRELVPNKEPSPLLLKCSTEPLRQEYITRMIYLSPSPLPMSISSFMDEDSKDTSATLDDSTCNLSVASSGNTCVDKSNKKKKLRKPPSGYVLYAGEIRKKLLREKPEAEFGTISKEVGQLWRNMSQNEKDVYERRASEIKQAMEKERALCQQQETNSDCKTIQSQQIFPVNAPGQQQRNYVSISHSGGTAVISAAPPSTAGHNASATTPIQYFQTSTGQVLHFMPSSNVQSGGAVQFATSLSDQQVQLIQPNQSSPQVIYQISQSQNQPPTVIGNQAQFMLSQNKVQQPQPPQQTVQAATGQVQSISAVNFGPIQHGQIYQTFNPNQQGNPLILPQQQNFSPVQGQQQQQQQQQSQPQPQQTTASVQTSQNFVSVPNRSARIFHSEIYQKYIDKVRRNSSTLSDWRQQLEFSKESVLDSHGPNRQAYINKLCNEVAPAFLDPKLMVEKDGRKVSQDVIVNTLFKLRDHLLQDALNIRTKVLGLEEL